MILCGGSSKIPKLQSRIKSLFEDAEILNTINPDEVIAVGAAKQASLLPEVNILEISKDIYYRNFLVGNFDWKDDCSYDVISALKFSSLKNFMYPIVFKKNFMIFPLHQLKPKTKTQNNIVIFGFFHEKIILLFWLFLK